MPQFWTSRYECKFGDEFIGKGFRFVMTKSIERWTKCLGNFLSRIVELEEILDFHWGTSVVVSRRSGDLKSRRGPIDSSTTSRVSLAVFRRSRIALQRNSSCNVVRACDSECIRVRPNRCRGMRRSPQVNGRVIPPVARMEHLALDGIKPRELTGTRPYWLKDGPPPSPATRASPRQPEMPCLPLVPTTAADQISRQRANVDVDNVPPPFADTAVKPP